MATFRQYLVRRLPGRSDALKVFSLAAFLVFSWTIFRLFYELPSWLYYLGIADILILTAYVMMFALFESALLYAFTCLLSLMLPDWILYSKFVAQGSLLVCLVCFAAVMAQRRLGWLLQLQSWQIIFFPLMFIVLVAVLLAGTASLLDRYARLSSLVNSLAERMTVFSYLYLPLGLVSLVVVVVRNLIRMIK